MVVCSVMLVVEDWSGGWLMWYLEGLIRCVGLDWLFFNSVRLENMLVNRLLVYVWCKVGSSRGFSKDDFCYRGKYFCGW